MGIAEKIAGEIVLSPHPGKTIKKWRNTFNLSQSTLASALSISPSVISDYETGRRKTPRIDTVRRIADAMIKLDKEGGGKIVSRYREGKIFQKGEFLIPIKAKKVASLIKGKILTGKEYMEKPIYGYTVINSLKAILSLKPSDYGKIYGASSERALIFTHVKYGRSPMIAIKVSSTKPAMVVYQRPKNVDKLALKISKIEHIPLVVSHLKINDLLKRLEEMR